MAMRIVGRERRKLRIRRKISGTAERPRLSVFRSAKHIYAQCRRRRRRYDAGARLDTLARRARRDVRGQQARRREEGRARDREAAPRQGIDLIPDFIPVLGYLDDLIIVPLGIWLVLSLIPQDVMTASRAHADEAVTGPRGKIAAIVIIAIWIVGVVALGWGVLAYWRGTR